MVQNVYVEFYIPLEIHPEARVGQEITHTRFTPEHFARFAAHLEEETALLHEWLATGVMDDGPPRIGLELEAWLVDARGEAVPRNEEFLQILDNPMVVPELAKFNVELNTASYPLSGDALERLHRDLAATWRHCENAAAHCACNLLLAGTLPTLRPEQLNLANMSPLKRYYALNEQILEQRTGRPLHLDIQGNERLRLSQRDVMLEAATTSLQIHLQTSPARSVRLFNAALLASAPMVAVCANSPYLFGKDLWDETRVPVFEQSVEAGGYAGVARGPLRRVSFGSGYVSESLGECFAENLEHFPVLLPLCSDTAAERLAHLRLHNGTIWRWNRPLVDFSPHGRPHLRIEHRVVPGGPTLRDSLANLALGIGLMLALAEQEPAPEYRLGFTQVRDNFYAAARYGLHATLTWSDGKRHALHRLLRERLLPQARRALYAAELEQDQVDAYLDLIAQRLHSGQTGAAWQRAFVARYGHDMHALLAAYTDHQRRGEAVAVWEV